ncbi:UDP-N-acetylmuramoyl-tripeptide--D-alanyl-D-alanine ligase [Solimonas marina]|uniref:UDP-N-acetylmuramoyl-tripeptide--D-alanyl-D-alanine ligase n=1 Tax=Solimonas marina TaxID=2714601 RepID=A0A970B6T0_9GAMM|nr:UDP-N-acetylmuramoyl-tripeptide--D-alanyl-D-alanine ligase [Solimonas marina]NKF22925.1 UDP-N-acetylmuramoyl-tripeptide--D-alanyl-D-alanine ligase [Solimonas marina]
MMFALSELLTPLNAELRGRDLRFAQVTTDSRNEVDGALFVALKGERFDGHAFVAQAKDNGAVAALVSEFVDVDLPQLKVTDTLAGLQQLAMQWRQRFDLPVVAVTGSNGKTTTKQLLAAVFAARGPVLATQGNLNNHIGVPLTLLRLRGEHRTAVIEMGANHAGEIALLAAIAQPDVGVVTQAGDAHLEGFGSRDGVAHAKGELFAALDARGVAVINADDVYAPLWTTLAGQASIIRFGLGEGADVRAMHVEPQAGAGTRFTLVTPQGRAETLLPMPGRHNVMNALAAAACGIALGLEPAQIAIGLSRAEGASGRLNWKTTAQGARLLDDSYNANPSSLRAGLELLSELPGRRWLVLGNMAELGPNSAQLHADAGSAARHLGIERLFAVGPMASAAVQAFGAGGQCFEDNDQLAAAVADELDSTITLLVKGSRSARMERVVAALTGDTSSGGMH